MRGLEDSQRTRVHAECLLFRQTIHVHQRRDRRVDRRRRARLVSIAATPSIFRIIDQACQYRCNVRQASRDQQVVTGS